MGIKSIFNTINKMNKLSISLLIFASLICLIVGQGVESTDDDMFEDDMKIAKKKNSRSFGLENKNQRWSAGIVPYSISNVFSSENKKLIRDAMDLIELKTAKCVKFVNRNSERNYISIQKLSGCWSYVGSISGEQRLSLASGCLHKGIIVHELMHALGFMHEQNRPDRDDFVDIKFENILEGRERNFKKYTDTYITYGPYDYYSIMHYTKTAFAKDYGLQTIVPKDSSVILKHSGSKSDEEIMTAIDIQAVKSLYECNTNMKTSEATTEYSNATSSPTERTTAERTTAERTTAERTTAEMTTAPAKVTTKKPTWIYARFTIKNDLAYKVRVFWVRSSGQQTLYRTLYPRQKYTQLTYKGHKWNVQTYCDVKTFTIGKGKFINNSVSLKVSEI